MSQSDPFSGMRDLFMRHGFPVDSAQGSWRPTPDDWIKIALGLAVKYNEPGFELSVVDHRPAAWADWVRDEAVDNRYFTLNPDGSLSDRKRPGMTLEQACRDAARHLDKEIKAGRLQGVKSISAASLKTAYSSRRAKELQLAPVIADYLRRDGEWRNMLARAHAFTVKSSDLEN